MAKLIIRLVNAVADVVNADPRRAEAAVAFLAQLPRLARRENLPRDRPVRADLDRRQGSLRHRQHEVRAQWRAHHRHARRRQRRDPRGGRPENFFLFGLTAEQVQTSRRLRPLEALREPTPSSRRSRRDRPRRFLRRHPTLFQPIVDNLLRHGDEYLLLADFRSYLDAQKKVGRPGSIRDKWTRMAILNVARMGKFSSDRAVGQYAEQIRNAKPVAIR